jgi:hypothetical protein
MKSLSKAVTTPFTKTGYVGCRGDSCGSHVCSEIQARPTSFVLDPTVLRKPVVL